MKQIVSIAITAIILTSCKKDAVPEYNPNVKGSLSVEFDNVAGSSDLQLTTGTYSNAVGESFKVNKLKYFVSNFVFTNINGSVYTVPQDSSYFLINETIASSLKTSLKVPEGEYSKVSFMIGVDSLRNTMDISKRTGVLDPTTMASDLYWSWNSGYIFFKIEGTSPTSASPGNAFGYHVGGFGGYNTSTVNNLKTITLDLTARGTPKVKAGKSANIHLFADILKALNGSTNMRFATVSMIHSAPGGTPIANNYISMFTHDHTEN